MYIFLIMLVKSVWVQCEVIQVWAISCFVCFNDSGGAKHRTDAEVEPWGLGIVLLQIWTYSGIILARAIFAAPKDVKQHWSIL